MIETTPIQIVESVGVRYFGWIRAKRDGSALKAAIDRLVRAVGRIVVWVEADAEVSTQIASRCTMIQPTAPPPKTSWPIAAKTSSALSTLPSPMPWAETPANAIVATDTRA